MKQAKEKEEGTASATTDVAPSENGGCSRSQSLLCVYLRHVTEILQKDLCMLSHEATCEEQRCWPTRRPLLFMLKIIRKEHRLQGGRFPSPRASRPIGWRYDIFMTSVFVWFLYLQRNSSNISHFLQVDELNQSVLNLTTVAVQGETHNIIKHTSDFCLDVHSSPFNQPRYQTMLTKQQNNLQSFIFV